MCFSSMLSFAFDVMKSYFLYVLSVKIGWQQLLHILNAPFQVCSCLLIIILIYLFGNIIVSFIEISIGNSTLGSSKCLNLEKVTWPPIANGLDTLMLYRIYNISFTPLIDILCRLPECVLTDDIVPDLCAFIEKNTPLRDFE